MPGEREKEHTLIHPELNNKHVLGKLPLLFLRGSLCMLWALRFYTLDTLQVSLAAWVGRTLFKVPTALAGVRLQPLVSLILQNVCGRNTLHYCDIFKFFFGSIS